MRATLHFLTFLSSAITMAPCREADIHLPAPYNTSFHWVDGFFVNVTWFWKRPKELPEDCKVEYMIQRKDNKPGAATHLKHYTDYFLSKDLISSSSELSIHAFAECPGRKLESKPVKVEIRAPKQHAELVKDFKCFFLRSSFNCSWIPIDQSPSPTVSYRVPGQEEEHIKTLTKCKGSSKEKGRNVCEVKVKGSQDPLILVESEKRMNTFRPQYAIPVPNVTVQENGQNLQLTWEIPSIGCDWNCFIWYKECGEEMHHREYKFNEKWTVDDIPYNKCCEYEFHYKLATDIYCRIITSDNSAFKYGTTKTCFDATKLVTIIIPIIVCFCVALSFYCFKKHEHIFRPGLERSVIKDWFNINRETKNPSDAVYTPNTEMIDPSTPLVIVKNVQPK
ncbi:uncharacterized protein LOC119772152 [Cyprinodon tularosa]|uniref:uncharacterized protein LOC119772152 n=1 Tax=Cyprinodon tularosa TaxID=77115 RepID=UPI0018E20BF0|nr:uncharacterized protein LOC119772152 [Cyprinodon tularosa]